MSVVGQGFLSGIREYSRYDKEIFALLVFNSKNL